MNLFLDDMRSPKDVTWIELPTVEWTIVRNYREFIDAVHSMGVPERVSFDHDLADEHYKEFVYCSSPHNLAEKQFRYEDMGEKTGYCAAKWLCEYCQENKVKFPEYYVHSFNPIGAENICLYVENYKRVIENARD